MSTVVVVGNPKPASRTLAAALHVARELTADEPDLVVDLGVLGPAVLDHADEGVTDLVRMVGEADLVVVASPTYKAAYTGLLKVFLDRLPTGTGLTGVAVPVMLGGSAAHSLVPELTLRPLLTELGATVLGRALYVEESRHDDPEAYRSWLDRTRPLIRAVLGGTR